MLKYLSRVFKRTGGEVNTAFFTSLSKALDEAGKDAEEIKKEMSITTATGEWLDIWGSWFGVSRIPGESDESLRERILDALRDEKLTIPAIIDRIKKLLGYDTNVSVYEPFNDVRIFNRSTFSGVGRFQDGQYYRIGVVDIILDKPVTEELIYFLNLIKSAGVKLVFTHKSVPKDGQVIDMFDDSPILSRTIHINEAMVDMFEEAVESHNKRSTFLQADMFEKTPPKFNGEKIIMIRVSAEEQEPPKKVTMRQILTQISMHDDSEILSKTETEQI